MNRKLPFNIHRSFLREAELKLISISRGKVSFETYANLDDNMWKLFIKLVIRSI